MMVCLGWRTPGGMGGNLPSSLARSRERPGTAGLGTITGAVGSARAGMVMLVGAGTAAKQRVWEGRGREEG